tara:strand:+ start:3482 stop:4150 length:669 start_codon:yes stop_codon:yes gene_type:complete
MTNIDVNSFDFFKGFIIESQNKEVKGKGYKIIKQHNNEFDIENKINVRWPIDVQEEINEHDISYTNYTSLYNYSRAINILTREVLKNEGHSWQLHPIYSPVRRGKTDSFKFMVSSPTKNQWFIVGNETTIDCCQVTRYFLDMYDGSNIDIEKSKKLTYLEHGDKEKYPCKDVDETVFFWNDMEIYEHIVPIDPSIGKYEFYNSKWTLKESNHKEGSYYDFIA